MAKTKRPITKAEAAALRVALHDGALHAAAREALELLNRGKALPTYLENALLKFNQAHWKDIERRILVPKIEERHRSAGKPRSKKSTSGPGSLEATATDLGLSVSTVERAVYDHEASKKGPRTGPQKR